MFPSPAEPPAPPDEIPVPDGRQPDPAGTGELHRDTAPVDLLTTAGTGKAPVETMMPPGKDVPDGGDHRAGTTTNILSGFLALFFILLICVMFTVSPLLAGTATQNSTLSKAQVQVSPVSAASTEDSPETPAVQAPSATPVLITSTPTPQPVQQVTPASYVTIEAAPTPEIPKITDITEDLPKPSTADYITIYSMDNQEAVSNFPYVTYDLHNPPLVVEYTIVPVNITDKKLYHYKIMSQSYDVDSNIERPYEDAWFRIVVRDKETGKIVLEDGWGRTYPNTLDTTRKIALYKGGTYRFEFYGGYVTVSLDMKVKKEGNTA